MGTGKHESRSGARRARPLKEIVPKWWKRLTAAVIGAGALAAAVTSIVALWPSSTPDQQNSATFQAVRAVSPIRLSEFDQRQKPTSGSSRTPAGEVHRALIAGTAALAA